MTRMKFKRIMALFVACCFAFTQQSLPVSAAPAQTPASPESFQSLDVEKLNLSRGLGKIEEIYKGTRDQTVILIQDAHAIPDAQKSIQRLIAHFQKKYGISFVGLEGASSYLDPQMFKSFPQQDVLREIFRGYLDKGELTAGTASAIFNSGDSDYAGLEDWTLYQDGLRYYLLAQKSQPELLQFLDARDEAINARKALVYSPALKEADEALSSFRKEKEDLLSVLQVLAKTKKPAEGSRLRLILDEAEGGEDREKANEIEVKKLAEIFDRPQITNRMPRTLYKEFQLKRQQFQTSQLRSSEFALYLGQLASSLKIPVPVSDKLISSMRITKQLKNIEGAWFFREFRAYVREVKDQLIENEDQRELDLQSEERDLLERFARLQLDQPDWKSIRAWMRNPSERMLDVPSEKFSFQYAFYLNAKKRDRVLFDRLIAAKTRNGESVRNSLMVAGGFHAEGLTQLFRQNGVSYAVLMPEITKLPEENHYEEQMKGGVSWKDHLKVENGKIDLYGAFVRGTRDKILEALRDAGLGEFKGRTLKAWRDQIIRDLSQQGRVAEASRYTRYIDEAVERGDEDDATLAMIESVKKFISGMKDLDQAGRLTPQNVARLLSPAMHMPPAAPGAAAAPSNDLDIEFVGMDPGGFIPVEVTTAGMAALEIAEGEDLQGAEVPDALNKTLETEKIPEIQQPIPGRSELRADAAADARMEEVNEKLRNPDYTGLNLGNFNNPRTQDELLSGIVPAANYMTPDAKIPNYTLNDFPGFRETGGKYVYLFRGVMNVSPEQANRAPHLSHMASLYVHGEDSLIKWHYGDTAEREDISYERSLGSQTMTGYAMRSLGASSKAPFLHTTLDLSVASNMISGNSAMIIYKVPAAWLTAREENRPVVALSSNSESEVTFFYGLPAEFVANVMTFAPDERFENYRRPKAWLDQELASYRSELRTETQPEGPSDLSRGPANPRQQAKIANIALTEGRLSPDSAMHKLIEAISKKTLASFGLAADEYAVVVSDSDDINAYFTEGGEKIIVFNRGLLDFFERYGILNQDSIAFVAGHEIGHALQEARKKSNPDYKPTPLAKEYDADDSGAQAMDELGQSPLGSSEVLAALRSEQSKGEVTWMTRYMERKSHPPTHRRQVNNRENIRRRNYWSNLNAPKQEVSAEAKNMERSARFRFDEGLYGNLSLTGLNRLIALASSPYDLMKLINLFHILFNYQIVLDEIMEARNNSGVSQSRVKYENNEHYIRAGLLGRGLRNELVEKFMRDNGINPRDYLTAEQFAEFRKMTADIRAEETAKGSVIAAISEDELFFSVFSKVAGDQFTHIQQGPTTQRDTLQPYSSLAPSEDLFLKKPSLSFYPTRFWEAKARRYQQTLPLDERALERKAAELAAEVLAPLDDHDRLGVIRHTFLSGLSNLDPSPSVERQKYDYLNNELQWHNAPKVLEAIFSYFANPGNDYLENQESQTYKNIRYEETLMINRPSESNGYYFDYLDLVIQGLLDKLSEASYEDLAALARVYFAHKTNYPVLIRNMEATNHEERIMGVLRPRVSGFDGFRKLFDELEPYIRGEFSDISMSRWAQGFSSRAEWEAALRYLLSKKNLKTPTVKALQAFFKSALDKGFLEAPEALNLLNGLLIEYGLEADWKDDYYYIAGTASDVPAHFSRAYAEILSRVADTGERKQLILQYFSKYKHNAKVFERKVFGDELLVLLEKTLSEEGLSGAELTMALIASGILPSPDHLNVLEGTQRIQAMEAFRASRQKFLANGIEAKYLDRAVAFNAWRWFFEEKNMPAYTTTQTYTGEVPGAGYRTETTVISEKRPLGTLKGFSESGYDALRDLLAWLAVSDMNASRFMDFLNRFELEAAALTEEDFGILFELTSFFVLRDDALPDYKTETLNYEEFTNPASAGYAASHQDYESKRNDYLPLWARFKESAKSDKSLAWGDTLYGLWKDAHPGASFEETKEAILKSFPQASRHRNKLLLDLAAASVGNPLKADTEFLDKAFFPQGESLLAEDGIRDMLARRIIDAKKAAGQLGSFDYTALKNFLSGYFSKDSLIGNEVLHQLLQDTNLTLPELHELTREDPHQRLSTDKKAAAAHYALELIADDLESRPAKDKLEFFEWLIGLRTERPDIVKYYEHKLRADASDLAAMLTLVTEAERYMFLATLFVGPEGILVSENIRREFLERVYGHAVGDNTFSARGMAEKETDMLFVIFRETFEASPELKQQDLVNGFFKHFLTNEAGASSKNLLIRDLLVSFGVVGVKLGQILSRNQLITDVELKKVLEGLSDGVEALDKRYLMNALLFGYEDQEARIEELSQFVNVIGPLLGSASVKQGYKAFQTDEQGETVREMALKFIRPMAHIEVKENMEILRRTVDRLQAVASRVPELAALKRALDMLSGTLLDEIEKAITREMDMAGEVAAQESIAAHLEGMNVEGWKIEVPKVIPSLKGAQFFADEFIYGKHPKQEFKALVGDKAYQQIARGILTAVISQMFAFGRYHADLHAGNIMVDVENKKIYFLDFGNTASVSKSHQDDFISFLAAVDSSGVRQSLALLKKMSGETVNPDLKKVLTAIINRRDLSGEVKLRQIKSALDDAKISFQGEFEILFKVFETIGYLTDELSVKEKHDLFRNVIVGRQLSSLANFFSGTTFNLIQSEAANLFRGRSELRTLLEIPDDSVRSELRSRTAELEAYLQADFVDTPVDASGKLTALTRDTYGNEAVTTSLPAVKTGKGTIYDIQEGGHLIANGLEEGEGLATDQVITCCMISLKLDMADGTTRYAIAHHQEMRQDYGMRTLERDSEALAEDLEKIGEVSEASGVLYYSSQRSMDSKKFPAYLAAAKKTLTDTVEKISGGKTALVLQEITDEGSSRGGVAAVVTREGVQIAHSYRSGRDKDEDKRLVAIPWNEVTGSQTTILELSARSELRADVPEAENGTAAIFSRIANSRNIYGHEVLLRQFIGILEAADADRVKKTSLLDLELSKLYGRFKPGSPAEGHAAAVQDFIAKLKEIENEMNSLQLDGLENVLGFPSWDWNRERDYFSGRLKSFRKYIETGDFVSSPEAATEIAAVLRTAVGHWNSAEADNIQVLGTGTLTGTAAAKIDPDHLLAAVSNIISNAFRALKSSAARKSPGYSPEFHVTLEDSADQITITLRDNGPGFPVDESGQSPLLQAGADGKQTLFSKGESASGSTGLGLWIAESTVRNAGGTIRAEFVDFSSPLKGARFVITLPRSELRSIEEDDEDAFDPDDTAIFTPELEKAIDDVEVIASTLGGNLGRKVSEITVNRIDEAFIPRTEIHTAILAAGDVDLKAAGSAASVRALLVQKLEGLMRSTDDSIGLQALYQQMNSSRANLTDPERVLLHVLDNIIPSDPVTKEKPGAERTTTDLFESNLKIYAEGIKGIVHGLLGISLGLRSKSDEIQRESCQVCPHSTSVFNRLANDFVMRDLGYDAGISTAEAIVGTGEEYRLGGRPARHLWTEIVLADGTRFYVSLVDSQFPGFGFDKDGAGRSTARINVFRFNTPEERLSILKERGIILSDVKTDTAFFSENLTGLSSIYDKLADIVRTRAAEDEIAADNTRSIQDFKFFQFATLLGVASMFAKSPIPEEQTRTAFAILEKAAEHYSKNKNGMNYRFNRKAEIDPILFQIAKMQKRLDLKEIHFPIVSASAVERILESFGSNGVPAHLELVIQDLEDLERQQEAAVEQAFQILVSAEQLTGEALKNPDSPEALKTLADFTAVGEEQKQLVYYSLIAGGHPEADVQKIMSYLEETQPRSELRSVDLPEVKFETVVSSDTDSYLRKYRESIDEFTKKILPLIVNKKLSENSKELTITVLNPLSGEIMAALLGSIMIEFNKFDNARRWGNFTDWNITVTGIEPSPSFAERAAQTLLEGTRPLRSINPEFYATQERIKREGLATRRILNMLNFQPSWARSSFQVIPWSARTQAEAVVALQKSDAVFVNEEVPTIGESYDMFMVLKQQSPSMLESAFVLGNADVIREGLTPAHHVSKRLADYRVARPAWSGREALDEPYFDKESLRNYDRVIVVENSSGLSHPLLRSWLLFPGRIREIFPNPETRIQVQSKLLRILNPEGRYELTDTYPSDVGANENVLVISIGSPHEALLFGKHPVLHVNSHGVSLTQNGETFYSRSTDSGKYYESVVTGLRELGIPEQVMSSAPDTLRRQDLSAEVGLERQRLLAAAKLQSEGFNENSPVVVVNPLYGKGAYREGGQIFFERTIKQILLHNPGAYIVINEGPPVWRTAVNTEVGETPFSQIERLYEALAPYGSRVLKLGTSREGENDLARVAALMSLTSNVVLLAENSGLAHLGDWMRTPMVVRKDKAFVNYFYDREDSRDLNTVVDAAAEVSKFLDAKASAETSRSELRASPQREISDYVYANYVTQRAQGNPVHNAAGQILATYLRNYVKNDRSAAETARLFGAALGIVRHTIQTGDLMLSMDHETQMIEDVLEDLQFFENQENQLQTVNLLISAMTGFLESRSELRISEVQAQTVVPDAPRQTLDPAREQAALDQLVAFLEKSGQTDLQIDVTRHQELFEIVITGYRESPERLEEKILARVFVRNTQAVEDLLQRLDQGETYSRKFAVGFVMPPGLEMDAVTKREFFRGYAEGLTQGVSEVLFGGPLPDELRKALERRQSDVSLRGGFKTNRPMTLMGEDQVKVPVAYMGDTAEGALDAYFPLILGGQAALSEIAKDKDNALLLGKLVARSQIHLANILEGESLMLTPERLKEVRGALIRALKLESQDADNFFVLNGSGFTLNVSFLSKLITDERTAQAVKASA